MSAKLRYRMESVGGEPVSLTAFARLTAEMTQLLTELDRARSGEPAVDWIITDLDIGSAIVEVEGQPLTSVADVSQASAYRLRRARAPTTPLGR